MSWLKRLALWLLSLAGLELALLAYFLLFGAFAYVGGSDTRSMQTALEFYGSEFGLLIRRLWILDLLVLLIWTLPLAAAYVALRPRWRSPRWLLFAPAFALACALWIALACLRLPTVLSGSLYGDGSSWTASLMRAVCSRLGPLWLALGFGAVAAAVGRLAGLRAGLATAGFYLAVIGALLVGERYHPQVKARPGSVLLLVADSLRADRFDAAHTPRMFALAQQDQARTIPQVAPPLARTTPAVVSLLTGRLPAETRVTTMFSNEETFRQTPSLVEAYAKAGWCTVALGEYPAEMLSKYQLGFERLDVPQARFKEIALEAVLSNDPIFLSTESWALCRTHLGRTMRQLVEGLPTFAAPLQLMKRLESAVSACGDRPAFVFAFADQPHFPYVQSWPFYLEKGGDYTGRFRFGKDDPNAAAQTAAEKQHVRDLYDNALLASDDAFGRLVGHLHESGQLGSLTVILTGDHGESLYDKLDIIGHGDRLGEMEGVLVPWVVYGRGKDAFAGLGPLVQSTRLAERIARINGVDYKGSAALPEDVLYLETDLWMAATPNVPKERVHYPELSGILTVKDKNADIELDRAFLSTIEYAKHRMWIIDGKEYRLEPAGAEVLAFADGRRVEVAALPPLIHDFLHRYYPDVASALVP